MNGAEDMERLRWQCRRGMLELDYLLRGFLDRHYPGLDATGKQDFQRLLACPDPFLYDWFVGNSAPEDPGLLRLVALIRSRP